MKIERMQADEAQAIAELETELFADAWSLRSIKETAEQPQAIIFTAKNEGKLLGYLIFYFSLDEGEIVRIAAEQSRQRQGVGSHLMDHLMQTCREKGISRIMLEVRESNAKAIAFYQTHGFTKDGIRRGFYRHPAEDAVLMSKELA